MRALPALIMLLGALAVLMTGAAPSGAAADASSMPPCHGAATHHAAPDAPAPMPEKATGSIDCCVACVGAPALTPPDRGRLTAPPPSIAATPASLPTGERPAPEPHPPRALLA